MSKEKNCLIKNRNDFSIFIYELISSYKEHPELWANRDLEAYLSALAGWVEDMDGYYLNKGELIPKNPDWQMIANMLSAAKIYE